MYCEQCGAVVEDGSKFCGNCGAPLAVSASEAPQPDVASNANSAHQQGQYGQYDAQAQHGNAPYGQAPYQQAPYSQPGYQQPGAYTPAGAVPLGNKSKIAAGLLGIFLGALGIHKFYLGYTKAGVIMLVVTLVAGLFTLGIAAAVMSIIGLVEGIMYLMKSDFEFYQTYEVGQKEWF